MLLEKMKNVIKYAIELDITYLETFLGYEGDKVIKITTKHQEVVDKIEAYLRKSQLDFKSEYEVSGQEFHIFVGVHDDSIFGLKKI